MNISEFERTKPTETLKAINDLLIFWVEKRSSVDPYFGNIQVDYDQILNKIKNIKHLFKEGK
ncbi:MAG: hypothetical protein AABY22_01385 [Nanoarchaeota archaeon]